MGTIKVYKFGEDYERSSIVQRLSSLVMVFILYNLEKDKKSEKRDTERIQIGTGFGLPLLFVLCITPSLQKQVLLGFNGLFDEYFLYIP